VDVASGDAYYGNLPVAKIKMPAPRKDMADSAAPTAPGPRRRRRPPTLTGTSAASSTPVVAAPPVRPEALPRSPVSE
jgi:hypothetical protein